MPYRQRDALGRNLKQARTKAGLSQQDVATTLRRTRQTIAAWEGAKAVPDALQLAELAQLYGTWADVLLFGPRFAGAAAQGHPSFEQLAPDVRERARVLWSIFVREGAPDPAGRATDPSPSDH